MDIAEVENRLFGNLPVHADVGVYPLEEGNGSIEVTGTEFCVICMNLPPTRLSITVPCSHHFCMECIAHWVWDHNTCPMCRQTVVSVRFLIANEQGNPVWHTQEPSRNPAGTPYLIVRENNISLETFIDDGIFLIIPAYMGSRIFYRLVPITENAHILLAMPPERSFFITGTYLPYALELLHERGVLPLMVQQINPNMRETFPALVAHPRHPPPSGNPGEDDADQSLPSSVEIVTNTSSTVYFENGRRIIEEID